MEWHGVKCPPRPLLPRGPTAQLPPPCHMFLLHVRSEAVSRQRAGRYAAYCSLLPASPPSSPVCSLLLMEAQRERIRNCQQDFDCDSLTKTGLRLQPLILGDGKKAQCLRGLLVAAQMCSGNCLTACWPTSISYHCSHFNISLSSWGVSLVK